MMKKKITIFENVTVITMNENRDIIENGIVVHILITLQKGDLSLTKILVVPQMCQSI